MRDFAKDENGKLGQGLSNILLSRDFWTLLPADVDAADLMVQRKYETAAEVRANRSQPMQFATVQAKFFEGKNAVRIARNYVINNDNQPRKAFLAFLHTYDANDDPVNYLFSAREIADTWEKKSDHFSFSLTEERSYEFAKLKRDGIRAKVNEAIAQSTAQSVAWAWAEASKTYCSVRQPHHLDPKYRVTKIGEACVALFEGGYSHLAHPLEMRKDVFNSPGTFDWGYSGSGPKLLAASVLTHFLCGDRPTENEINLVVKNLVKLLAQGQDARFGKAEIFKALADLSYDLDLEDMVAARNKYDKVVIDYSSYFQDLSAPSEQQLDDAPVMDEGEGGEEEVPGM